MKKIRFTLFLSLSIACIASAQITFNKRFHFDFSNTVFTNIWASDSCYYVIGIFRDTIPYVWGGNLFIKFDLEGNPLIIKTIETSMTTWDNGLVTTPDSSGFYCSAYSYNPNMQARIIRYDTEGDTLWTKAFDNPFAPPNQNFIAPREILTDPQNGDIILFCDITATGNNFNEVLVIRTDSLGELKWMKKYGNPMINHVQSALFLPSNEIVFSIARNNLNQVTEDYTLYTHLKHIDSLGNVTWLWSTPPTAGQQGGAKDMLLLENGNLVIVSDTFVEIEASSINGISSKPIVFELSPEGQILWQTSFFPPEQLVSPTELRRIIPFQDGSGYLLAGTYNEDPAHFYNTGWLVKISSEGQFLWERKYAYLDGHYRNILYDLKQASDGGFVLCGESINAENYGDNTIQQGWLLKLDEYACLVPGCQISTSLMPEGEEMLSEVNIYPNPTSQFLNIWVQGKENEQTDPSSIQILDTSGRTVQEFICKNQTTFIIPVNTWPNGLYFIRHIQKEKILSQQTVVVSH